MKAVELVDALVDPLGAVAVAAERLQAGEVVVLPTETVYGVAAVASDAAAVDELFRRKGRPAERQIAVLVANVGQVEELAKVDDRFERLASAFWPGPLTLVLSRRVDVGVILGADDEGLGTVGVRCPAHDLARSLAARVGPIATTSANRSGESTPTDAAGAADVLGGGLLALDGGPCNGKPSTVLDLSVEPARILREGPIGVTDIAKVGVVVDR